MRWDYPSHLPKKLQKQAESIADRFLQAVGYTHGFFNMEFVFDEETDQIKVIEFNPRMAAQFSDLYARVDGKNLHDMATALSHGIDPTTLPVNEPTAACASSFVYRSFDPTALVGMPTASEQHAFQTSFPDGLLLQFPKLIGQIRREFKWSGSYRFGIVHLGGDSPADLARRCEQASSMLGWTAPYVEHATNLPGFSDYRDTWPAGKGTENVLR